MPNVTLFDPAHLQAAVADALGTADVPADHRGAFVTYADQSGVKAVLATRIGASDHWQAQVVAQYGWNGTLAVGAEVLTTW